MLNENEHTRKIGREKKWLLIRREKHMYEQAHVESLQIQTLRRQSRDGYKLHMALASNGSALRAELE